MSLNGNQATAAAELVLSDAYLVSDFTKQAGPGSIDSVLDLDGKGVGFAISGITATGTRMADGFPLGDASGCTPHPSFPGNNSDCSSFKSINLMFTNLGTQVVFVNVFVNTGFTGGGGSCAGGAANAACDTSWQGEWATVGPGGIKRVRLDFNSARAFNCADDPDGACSDGPGQAIIRLDEVTAISFSVIDFGGGPTDTWLVVNGE